MRGKVKWEGMWVIFVECVAYSAALVSPDADFVSIRLTNGRPHRRTALPPSPPSPLPPPPSPSAICRALLFIYCPGMWVEWMRYAGWILTCPVLLMTLVSMPTLAPALALAWP